MNDRVNNNLVSLVREDLDMLRRNWGWFVALGVLLVLAGVAGIVLVGFMTLVSIMFIGWLMIFAGALEIAHAVWRRGWRGFALDLVSGLITLALGVLIVLMPGAAASALTLILGFLFLIGGALRAGLALTRWNPYGAWTLLHGLVSMLLGVMILAGWPGSTVWVIGTLVAVDLIINGARLISLGLTARSLGREGPPARTPTDRGAVGV